MTTNKTNLNPSMVTLRHVTPQDLHTLFAFESDPAWHTLAKVKPRTHSQFHEVWKGIFAAWASGDNSIRQRVILADGVLCGTIGCRTLGDRCTVGYGLGQSFWGRGIASRALGLFLQEVPIRPMHATAAASNIASIRVLQRHGFTIIQTRTAPETDRCCAREEVTFLLA